MSAQQPTQPRVVPPRTIVNAGSRETYRPTQWTPVRPGADDHKQVKSLGIEGR